MIVQKVLPSLYNGMSEQPSDLKLENQCDLQVNAISDLVFGLSKREPTVYVKNIAGWNFSPFYKDAFLDVFEAPNGKSYLLIIPSYAYFKIYDIQNNTIVPVNISAAYQQYIITGNKPIREKIKTLNTRQGLVILNTEVVVKTTTDVTAGTLTGTVQQFSKLPTSPSTGDIYAISGDEYNKYTTYYVKFTGSVWEECAKPNIVKSLDNLTLPHVLVLRYDTSNNEYFEFMPLNYAERTVGDDNSNPLPSFVDRKINDMFLFRGRMGFLTDDGVILSKADEYTNFFYGTALETLDDDPIDITVETKTKAKLYNAIPFNKNLTIFSENQQFTLTSGDALLTSKSASVVPATYFKLDMVEPIGVDDRLYFVSSVEGKTRLMEYFVSGETYNETAIDISYTVPSLLPKITKIINSNANNIIFCFSKQTPTKLYVYKYFFDKDQRMQSSWSYFEFAFDIINIVIYDNYLYLLIEKEGETYLEKMFLKNSKDTPKLDRLTTVSNGVFDGIYTTFVLPYRQADGQMVLIDDEGFAIDMPHIEGTLNSNKVLGDFSQGTYKVGVKYPMRYVFSKPVIKTESKIGITDIIIKIQKISISYVDTGYFELLIKPKYKDIIRYIVNNTIVNVSELDKLPLLSKKEDFIVMNNAETTDIEIYNDSHLPSSILTASFTLNYFLKGRVI